jgi:hypothetical protein
MINLPSSTYVGKNVPKEKFYSKCAVSTAIKNLFVKYVEQIVWQNKLTAQTVAAEKGLLVNEIDVFEVKMRLAECPRKLFEFIDQNLHHHNVFVLTFEDRTKLFVNFKEKEKDATFLEAFEKPWKPAEEPVFDLTGGNMDEIYESIVKSAYVKGVFSPPEVDIQNQARITLKDKITRFNTNSKIRAQIEKLEKKLANEKQFNRQMEIRAEIKKLEQEVGT